MEVIVDENARRIIMLIDEQKNIVIFPISKTDFPQVLADGTVLEYGYLPAFFPIELKSPYTADELAERIKYGIEQYDKHQAHNFEKSKVTVEAKYCGIRSFKQAVKGKLYIDLGWDSFDGKYIILSVPLKSGYAYINFENVKLPDDADYIDFANKVIELSNIDITKHESFKVYKNKLNI